ncbi:MAG: DUF1343 domain-containing protein [Bacteroidetes bacterium]|jgi:uncharacterized protein YbbC (DUF1343 family)|nr:DUF1343 domain-containing protein [Bacteroidota bacterium]
MNQQTFRTLSNLRSGLLCNHTSWISETGSYFFESIPGLTRIFFPEHGLFAEFQDQVPVEDENLYKEFGIDAETVSLYGEKETSLLADPGKLKDLEVLFVDLEDIGSRYFTYSVTLGLMIESIITHAPNLKMVLIDRENPAGLQIEGSQLPEKYSSFIGWTGLPHRHGLSMAELALFFYKKLDGNFPLYIQTLESQDIRSDFTTAHPENVQLLEPLDYTKSNSNNAILAQSQFIPPSPNIPNLATPYIFPGQCLLEGTNLSEGRGTTRPFEQFGAPYIKPLRLLKDDESFKKYPGAILRPIRFLPTFHKWKGDICSGFQIHLTGKPYHSLLHSLYMIRSIKEKYSNSFEWREGVYEFGSGRKAIELLAGDTLILDYLNGKIAFKTIKEYLRDSENRWLKELNQYKIYKRTNFSILKHS